MAVRLKRIGDSLSLLKVDCFIVTKPANVTWLTGFMGDDSWAIVRVAGFQPAPQVILVTDSRYIEQAKLECRGTPRCRIIVRKDAMIKTVGDLLQKQRIKKIAVEKSTTIAEFDGLKKSLTGRVISAGNIVETLRRIKDDYEVAAIRSAAKIAAQAFKSTRKHARPGISENELAGILDLEIRKLGGRNAFETIVAFGPNGSRPHHRPTTRKLRNNDSILVDFGVRLNGYCCDITRCFTIGKPNRLYKKAYAAVEQAQEAALKMVRAGVDVRKVDEASRQAIRKTGLPVYGHGTGHGLGLEVHELPVISNKSQGLLQPGDVITIEPGVYIPGKLGIRIEDDVLVTENGYVLLSGYLPHYSN